MTPPHDAPLKIIGKASAGTIAQPPLQLLTHQGGVRDLVFLDDLSNAATQNCARRPSRPHVSIRIVAGQKK